MTAASTVNVTNAIENAVAKASETLLFLTPLRTIAVRLV
jgi:flavin-binding protein dodecin